MVKDQDQNQVPLPLSYRCFAITFVRDDIADDQTGGFPVCVGRLGGIVLTAIPYAIIIK